MIWIFLVLLIFQSVLSVEFFVSVNGSDSNPGTFLKPFRTIGKAKDNVQSIKNQDNIVHIFPGTYEESLTFSYLDSATNGFLNSYQAYDPKNKPILFGGKVIKNSWTYDTTVKAYKTFVGIGVNSRQLFVNNRRSKVCRGGLPFGTKVVDSGYQLPSGYEWWSKAYEANKMEFVEEKHWVQMRCLVDSISSTGLITMQNPCWKQVKTRSPSISMDTPSWIENNLMFLDKEDQWYLDSVTGYLYYIPLSTEPIEKSVFYLPVNERLIYGVGNSSHPVIGLNFDGFVFLSATWLGPSENGHGFPENQANVMADGTSPIGNVEFYYPRKVSVKNSVFTQLGGIALLLGSGTQFCEVSGNLFYDVSSIGIKIGDEVGNRPSLEDQVGNIFVYNNEITLNGQDYAGAPGIMIGYCYNCTVSHNLVQYTTYTGISHSWGWNPVKSNFEGRNMITNNLVNNTMMVLFDGGCFYTLGTQDVARSTCKENVFLNSHNCYGSLYLDDGSQYWDVYDNIVFGNVMSTLFKGGSHNIHDNWWQNRGIIKECGNHQDISFMNNKDFCAPCNPTCTDCGPISFKDNHDITSLDQAPQSILNNAGLVGKRMLKRKFWLTY